MAGTVLWIARQVCSDCGEGNFRRYLDSELVGTLVLCTECGHEHTMDPWNLDEHEHFDFDESGLLVVIATTPNSTEEN